MVSSSGAASRSRPDTRGRAKDRWHLAEVHLFERLGRTILFDVVSLHCYEITPIARSVVEACRRDSAGPLDRPDPDPANSAVRVAIDQLREIGVLLPGPRPTNRQRQRLARRSGIRHLELMVTHGCNMRCRYCYGSDEREGWQDARHLYGSSEAGMSRDTARRGVDFLFEASGGFRDLSVVFFGGEPLLEFDLIRSVVAYVREREQASGKRVALSLSTNGLSLTPAVVEFLVAQNIGCQVSIDGPEAMHDRNRRLADGRGSYAHVMRGVRRLIERRPGRVPARVTVTGDDVDLPAIAEHLFGIGFGSVHVEPVVAASGPLALRVAGLQRFERQTEELAETLVRRVRSGRVYDFANLVRHVRNVHRVDQRLAHYCGAARTYLALGQDGAFYPCHRFVGMPEYRMGDLDRGFDDTLQRRILGLTVDDRPGCRDCWARYLCGGGCWKHGVDVHGDLARPDTEASCRLIRHQIECAMAVNAALKVGGHGPGERAGTGEDLPATTPATGDGT